jgi:hypothetical protein
MIQIEESSQHGGNLYRMKWLRLLVGTVIVIVSLTVIGWIGLLIPAPRFRTTQPGLSDSEALPIPDDLPAPVTRYARVAFGESIPRVESAIIVGRADMTFNGLTFPGRFKFYHDLGRAYYHELQLTWFRLPILTVHERYKDGNAIMDVPGDRVEDVAEINAAANQALWGEAIWMPSLWFTDPRVRWEAIDAHSARLIVPDAEDAEHFTVHFDPETGLITEMTAMRYQNPGDTERVLWINRPIVWDRVNGVQIPVVAETQWADNAPWAVWRVDEIQINVDVSERLNRFGAPLAD